MVAPGTFFRTSVRASSMEIDVLGAVVGLGVEVELLLFELPLELLPELLSE